MTPEIEQFNKKRRNLVASAVLVGFINLAGAELDRLNLVGNEITFTNPNVIPIALGIMLLYTIIRYVQYEYEIRNKGFRERFLERARVHLARYLLRRELKRKNRNILHHLDKLDFKRRPEIRALPLNGSWRVASLYPHMKDAPGNLSLEDLKLTMMELVIPFVRASVYVGFRTRLGTDYIMPYVLATMAVCTYFPFVQAWALLV